MEVLGHQPKLTCFYLVDTIVLTFERIGQVVTRCLCIDRSSAKLTEKDLSVRIIKESLGLLESRNVQLFLGVLHLKGMPFLLFVDEVKQVCRIEGYPIFEIVKLNWASVSTSISSLELQSVEEQIDQISSLVENGGYYYCKGYDLTRSKQYSLHKKDHQEKFMWNYHLAASLTQHNISLDWTLPIIQGFIRYMEHKFSEQGKLKYILISRRSCKRAGTRFYSRGVDDLGQVSNFVESEQLLYLHNLVLSHVQIRGSVPVFWQQLGIDGLASNLKLNRTVELTESAFISHFIKLKNTYKRFLCVNLLSVLKQSEAELTDFFEKCIQKTEPKIGQFVKYEYFDFHDKCRGEKFSGCNPLIQKLKAINESFRFYCYDEHAKEIVSKQEGTIRTNCLDCLDRTNFVQTKLAIQALDFMLHRLGIHFPVQLSEDMDQMPSCQLVQKLKLIWADNGDMISRHYTDIGSTHTDVTRQGKRTLLGLINHKWRSLNRFYKQFTDSKKQEAINIFLGRHLDENNPVEETLSKRLKEQERNYSSYLETTFYVVAWNVNLKPPVAFTDSMFNFSDDPVFVVVGLQGIETSDGLISGLLKVQTHKDAWIKKISDYLCKQRQYTSVSTHAAAGCLIMLYFKSHHIALQLAHISDISHSKLKMNMFNNDRNLIMTRLKVFDTTILFANCYFTKAVDFLECSEEIHEKAFQQSHLGQQREVKISGIDYKFVFGHVGDSIACPITGIKQRLERYGKLRRSRDETACMKILSELSEADVLNQQRYRDPYLQNYSEGPLIFLPTSLIDIDRTYSDATKPSWSERIFVNNDENSIIKQHFYKSLEIFETGHLPVASLYSIDLKIQDMDKLKSLRRRLASDQI